MQTPIHVSPRTHKTQNDILIEQTDSWRFCVFGKSLFIWTTSEWCLFAAFSIPHTPPLHTIFLFRWLKQMIAMLSYTMWKESMILIWECKWKGATAINLSSNSVRAEHRKNSFTQRGYHMCGWHMCDYHCVFVIFVAWLLNDFQLISCANVCFPIE